MRIRCSRATYAAKPSSSRRRAPRRGGGDRPVGVPRSDLTGLDPKCEYVAFWVCGPPRRGRSTERTLHRCESTGWGIVRESSKAPPRQNEAADGSSHAVLGEHEWPSAILDGDAVLKRSRTRCRRCADCQPSSLADEYDRGGDLGNPELAKIKAPLPRTVRGAFSDAHVSEPFQRRSHRLSLNCKAFRFGTGSR